MRTVQQLGALGALLATTASASAISDPGDFGTMGKSLRNRNVFDRLVARQTTSCPLGTYCEDGMTCCGMYCCFSWGTCSGSNEFLKTCVSDFTDDITSATNDMIDDILNSTSTTDTSSSGDSASGTVDPEASASFDFDSPESSSDFTSDTSDTFSPTSSSSSSTSSKKSGFAGWSTGAKAGMIVGCIAGAALLGGVIWWIAFMTCCRKRHKVQSVAQLQAQAGSVPPPPPPPPPAPHPVAMSPPPMTQTPAPPYGTSELGGAQDHYAFKPDANGNYPDPAVVPKFDPVTGAYTTVNHQEVHEAPENSERR